MWPNCLGAVRKSGIRCPHQLVVEGGNCDIEEAGVLSTFYILIYDKVSMNKEFLTENICYFF